MDVMRQIRSDMRIYTLSSHHLPFHYVIHMECVCTTHPFQLSLPTPRTLSHKSLFFPKPCRLWQALPSSSFPESYNFPLSNIRRINLILSVSPLSLSLSSVFLRVLYRQPWPLPNIQIQYKQIRTQVLNTQFSTRQVGWRIPGHFTPLAYFS